MYIHAWDIKYTHVTGILSRNSGSWMLLLWQKYQANHLTPWYYSFQFLKCRDATWFLWLLPVLKFLLSENAVLFFRMEFQFISLSTVTESILRRHSCLKTKYDLKAALLRPSVPPCHHLSLTTWKKEKREATTMISIG